MPMTALEYLREKARMTNNCFLRCKDCPLSITNNGMNIVCVEFESNYPEKAIAIVEKWSKEHPKKTYLDDFKEKFPNAPLNDAGFPRFCRQHIYNTTKLIDCITKSCSACWNEKYKEE